MKTIYVFNCSEHGNESSVFCFRAFRPENDHLWQKYILTPEPAVFEPGELDKFLNGLRYTTTDPDTSTITIIQY